MSSARVLGLLGALAVAGGLVAGCSKEIPGTPQADPAQMAAAASADTTCDEYSGMTNSEKRAVILAIGADNPLVERSPELWITIAGALCTFSDPDITVREVLNGQGMR